MSKKLETNSADKTVAVPLTLEQATTKRNAKRICYLECNG